MDRGGSTAGNRGIEHCLVSEMDHDFVDGSSANLFSEETQNPKFSQRNAPLVQ